MVSHLISTNNSGRVAKGHHRHFQIFPWQPLHKQEHEQHIHLSISNIDLQNHCKSAS